MNTVEFEKWKITADSLGLPHNYPNHMARSETFDGMDLDEAARKNIIRLMITNVAELMEPAHFMALNDKNPTSLLSAFLSFFSQDYEMFDVEQQRNHLLCMSMLSVACLEKEDHAPTVLHGLIQAIRPNDEVLRLLDTFDVQGSDSKDITADVVDYYNQEYTHGNEGKESNDQHEVSPDRNAD